MGILYSNAELMIRAKIKGIRFDNVLTIGHLKLFLTKKEISKLVDKYDLNIEVSSYDEQIYSDEFFRSFLNAKDVQSLDYSDYENCDIVHDMNKSIDSKYFDKFDIVIDGGTLEHVFNFPIALANCMNMLKQGGSLFIFTMANNHLGHGFYQFSPELFFRALNQDNGFNVIDISLEEHKYPGAELNRQTNIYKVEDPIDVRSRVGLVSKSPVMMMVHAIREELKPIFESYPIQSDYVLTHQRYNDDKSNSTMSSFKIMIKKLFYFLPQNIRNHIEGQRQLFKYSFKNSTFYKKINNT